MTLDRLMQLGAGPIILLVASFYAAPLPLIYGVVGAMKRPPRAPVLPAALAGVTKGLFFGLLVMGLALGLSMVVVRAVHS